MSSASRSMTTSFNAAIVAGVIAARAGVSAPVAQGEPSIIPGITVMTIVKWSGTDCISVRAATGQRDLCDPYQQPPSEAVVDVTPSRSGPRLEAPPNNRSRNT
jgi:hypothetical protein